MTSHDRQEELRRRIADLGFDQIRFAALTPAPDRGLRAWLDSGYQADMAWMERTAAKRLDPGRVLPGARSIIMLGVAYSADIWPPPERPAGPGARPVWARYAAQADYHDTIKPGLVAAGKLLEEMAGLTGQDYRYYVDTGPVLERGWAGRAGVGFIGKNAMLISRRHGNWLFLSALLTRAEFVPDPPVAEKPRPEPVGLLCGTCTRCLDACPTRAFPAPGVVDSRRCISYQTIENRGIIPRELRAGIGLRVFGCDVCLEVCPWNRFARAGRGMLVAARAEIPALTWPELLTLTPERFTAAFRRTPIRRLKLAGLLRNACIGAGNTGDAGLLPWLVPLAGHASPLVRLHAVWAVRRLGGAELLREARAVEKQPEVLAEYES